MSESGQHDYWKERARQCRQYAATLDEALAARLFEMAARYDRLVESAAKEPR